MSFEAVTRNTNAIQRRIVMADPQALRECADRIEASAKVVAAGESVLCELTPTVTIVFKPEIIQAARDQ